MHLQEAVLWDVQNELFGHAGVAQQTGTDGRCSGRLSRCVASETWLAFIEHTGLVLVFLNTLALGLSADIAVGWAGWSACAHVR